MFTVKEIKFTKPLADVELSHMNVKATFECELSQAGLKVDWCKGSHKLRTDDKYEITASGVSHTLTVCDVTADDVSEYTANYQHLSTSAKLSLKGTRTCTTTF